MNTGKTRFKQGHTVSNETREKIRATLLGHAVDEATRRKIGARFRGLPKSAEHREKIRVSQIGRRHIQETRNKMSGVNAPSWRGGLTPIHQKIRNSLEYKIWRKAVFDRDNYTCQACGDTKGGNLNADHVMPFSLYTELRFEVLNGRTLCVECHKKTPTYGARLSSNKQYL